MRKEQGSTVAADPLDKDDNCALINLIYYNNTHYKKSNVS